MKDRVPVSCGDVVQLNIGALNHNGEGVGRHGGFAVFVPGALPGEVVRARVTTLRANYAQAALEWIGVASPHRVIPICDLAADCGGCQLLHLSYDEQLRYKRRVVEDALQRIGGFGVPVAPVAGMAEPLRYRNKVQVPLGTRNGSVVAGFYERRSHNIVPLECCYLQPPVCDRVILAACRIVEDLGIPIYNEQTHTGFVRHLLTRYSFSAGNVLLAIITNGRTFQGGDAHSKDWGDNFTSALRRVAPELSGIVQIINTQKGNIVLGPEEVLLWGVPHLHERLGGLEFKISPRSFFQVNTQQTEVLYEKAVEYAALTGAETVFDLYCGSGGVSLYMARGAGRVIGVESAEPAVRDARENAAMNGISNAEFHVGRVETVVPGLYKQGTKADVVVVDPPRKGCDITLLKILAEMQPKKIIYISCNPATLARDLRILSQGGDVRQNGDNNSNYGRGAHRNDARSSMRHTCYFPIAIQPVDMFPQTTHVEVVALLEAR